MCSRSKGKRLLDTYEKYITERKVDPEDREMLDILEDSSRIRYVFRKDGLYAKVIYP